MNCRKGDLAIVVKSDAGNEGRIVRCIRLMTRAEKQALSYFRDEPMWITDTNMVSTWGTYDTTMWDSYMRPIRDNPGEDETLTWAGKPEKVQA